TRLVPCGERLLDLSRPRVMGILNVTPDSFYDGGQLYRDQRVDVDAVLRRAEEMWRDGAAILDVGGESTRPGAQQVSEAEELDRVSSAVEAIAERLDIIISVDSSNPAVMTESARLGAGLLNDIRGFSRDGVLEAAAASGLAVCVMHMQGQPDTMQANPAYVDLIADINNFFEERVRTLNLAGISQDRIILDPGFGFGKTAEHNFHMLARLTELVYQDLPILVGLSRKSMISSVLERPTEDRLFASLALATMAVERGARIVRVHDVGATADAIAMWHRMSQSDT
ncbi:MAG: dihydropteroate synthase, partial [Pseudomonadota bacterium]|nr:dihydropteroate synthase [Pseudomonadota bacterium]